MSMKPAGGTNRCMMNRLRLGEWEKRWGLIGDAAAARTVSLLIAQPYPNLKVFSSALFQTTPRIISAVSGNNCRCVWAHHRCGQVGNVRKEGPSILSTTLQDRGRSYLYNTAKQVLISLLPTEIMRILSMAILQWTCWINKGWIVDCNRRNYATDVRAERHWSSQIRMEGLPMRAISESERDS